MNTKTRKEYGSFENFRNEEREELMRLYKDSHYELLNLYNYPSFEDFCLGQWQRVK